MKNTLVSFIVVGILAPAAFLLSQSPRPIVTTIIPCPGTIIATSTTASSSFPCPPQIVVSVEAGYQPTDDELMQSLAAAWVTVFGTGITETPDAGGMASSTEGTLVIGEVETPIYIGLPDFDISYELPYTSTSTGVTDPSVMPTSAGTTTTTTSTATSTTTTTTSTTTSTTSLEDSMTELINQLANLAGTSTATGTATSTLDDAAKVAEAELKLQILQLELKVQELLKAIAEITSFNAELAKREATNTLICPDLPRNVFTNDKGYDIRLLQIFLKDLGPQVYLQQDVNGIYDAATKTAVGNFQELVSLVTSGQPGYGVTGPKTRGAIKNYCVNNNNPAKYVPGQSSYVPSSNDTSDFDVDAMTSDENNSTYISSNYNSGSTGGYASRYNYGTNSYGSSTGTTNTSSYTPTSNTSRSVPVSFVDSTVPLEVSVGQSYEVQWNGSSQYVELITIEAYKDNVRHFFGSYVLQTGFANLIIPQDFAGKGSMTLIINHKGQLKDSAEIIVK